MTEITVRLERGNAGLAELTEGVFAVLTWLEDNGDGTYTIHAGGVAPTDEAGEAYLRVLLERVFDGETPDDRWPPIATREPTAPIANLMDRIRLRLGWATGEAE